MYLVVPNTEIGGGIYNKMTGVVDAQQEELESNRIWTQRRLYNELMKGAVPLPTSLCLDEGHHVDNTHSVIREACGNPPTIGLTATPYRGTPKETARLREAWPNIYRALTLHDAFEKRIISRPDFLTHGLLNDDLIEISSGEFLVSSVDGAVSKILPDVVDRVKCYYDYTIERWLRPLMFRVNSVVTADALTAALNDAGLKSLAVTGSTKGRQDIFDRVIGRTHALVQIRVVGEGVDLPMRILVDLAPTTSPMLWMQAVGRITRPVPDGEDPPLYICTNHNITRHGYLFESLIPVSQVIQNQKAFGPEYKPSRRSLTRGLGLEGFGRFTVSLVPLRDGTAASLYSLQTRDGLSQFAVILHPMLPEPFYFQRTNALTGETGTTPDGWTFSKKQYGRWKRIESMSDCDGYVSVKPGIITDKMRAWYKRSAARVGLHPDHEPNAREFTALPILTDCSLKFGG